MRSTLAPPLALALALTACGQLDFAPRDARRAGADAPVGVPTAPVHFAFESGAFFDGGMMVATCTTCPSSTPSRPGRGAAALFAGAQDLSVADQPALRWPALTVAMWFRIDTLPADVTVLASKQLRSVSTIENTWELFLRSDADLNVGIITDTGRAELNLLPDLGLVGTWHHVAHSYDGTRLRFYLDGVLRGAREASGLDYDDSPFGFGHDVDVGDPFAYLRGALDDVMVFDRALTEAEVAALAAP